MPLDMIVNQTGQYAFEPSDDEVKTAIGIMKTFEEILLDPDAQDGMERLYLGCASDRVAFDDLGYDLEAPGSPAAASSPPRSTAGKPPSLLCPAPRQP